MLSEISSQRENKYCIISFMCEILNSQTHRNRIEWWLPGTRVWKQGPVDQGVQSFSYARLIRSEDLMYSNVTIVNNTILDI